jgi:O-antigen ligase
LNINYSSRAGYEIDSILKWLYFLLAVLIFYISSKVFNGNKQKYIVYFLYGAIIASLYSWYLFIFSMFGFEPILLFGMEENPQKISLLAGEVIRCGTFKEGNFMAFFLFVSTVIALYAKKKKLAIYFTLSIITTVSTIGILTSLLFWLLHLLKVSKTKNGMIKLLLILFLSLSSLMILLQNDDFNMMFTSKLDITNSEITDQGAYSKEDRKNTILNALNMGIDNPVFGIGLSNFALHYKYYNEIYGSGFKNYDSKVIQNNVYAEIFSELGLIGLFLFGLFIYSLYLESKHDKSKVLTFGLLGCFFYFMAFPTFTILFMWVFFGLIHSLPKDNYEISH